MSPLSPIARGIGLAGLAALLFGATAPLLKLVSAGLGPFASAALIYLGAGLGAAALLVLRGSPPGTRSPLGAAGLARLAMVVLSGAVAAPALLVAGLARTDAATGSLLLALEAPFTIVLAGLALREPVGRRVVTAAALITAGALVLGVGALVGGAVSSGRAAVVASGHGGLGAALVTAAALAWALDNLLSRALADVDPLRVVALKGLLGAVASTAVALAAREPLPSAPASAALLALGAIGYGFSLRLYLGAQSRVGAARTASVFASAPFVGGALALALALGSARPGWPLPAAAALMLAGVALHARERHGHRHTHAPLAHDHLHDHADGHHAHTHDPMPAGPHAHPHTHEPITHDHEHAEDSHHRHAH